MSSRRWFAVSAASLGLALAISAVLYVKSRAADLGAHARVLEAIGRGRTLDRLQSEQMLEARFGLINQYDSINSTGDELDHAEKDLAGRMTALVGPDPGIAEAVGRLETTLREKRSAIERFKRENSILRNSTYYLPVAAREAEAAWPGLAADRSGASAVIQRMTQAGLAYNLIGDASTRDGHEAALSDLRSVTAHAPADARQPLGLLLAHGNAILREVAAVDEWMHRATTMETVARFDAVDRAYEARFGATARASNTYRIMLYGWSLVLLVGVATTGVQLRRLYAGLETRVAERTAELREAVAALWGEMRLARRIQEALVPSSPELTACEVAARMEATDEVGGDYYDVIRGTGYEWILIGDVSGHGVPAGLVMMMCHTAVRTAVRQDPELGPGRLLAIVNSVLTDAIRQLGEDKYMTITALRRAPDGSVRFAGAHQDLHIYRAATGKVESIESRGVWLGLRPDIEHTLVEQEFRLDQDDVLLLHTDGITEAVGNGARFDTRGVRMVLGGAGGKSAEDVVAALFAKLREFEISDDATVLVVRQLASRTRGSASVEGAPRG